MGTGAAGTILQGANDQVLGGIFRDQNSSALAGDWNLGVFGDVGNVRGSGVTVLPQSQLDHRCSLFQPIFEAVVGPAGIPPTF